ncbi:MAG: 1,4-alpha-glucan branching protein GlgB [Eubacteriales bacterium]
MTGNDIIKNPQNDSLPIYLFHQGTNFRAYEYLGVHCVRTDDMYTYYFRVWAPNAIEVSLNSDFTDWDAGFPMNRINKEGIWEAEINSEDSLAGKFYKFKITGKNGIPHMKADPYAFQSETLKKTASVIPEASTHVWKDSDWMKKRSATLCPKQRGFKPKVNHFYSAPMNIYEVHLGSWKTRDGESTKDGEHYLNYREIADKLAPYVRGMNYTHIELMPIMEHPFDGSWGYQVCGYYAPTSRYGTPDDFRYFVEKMHENGIGVILDWVPAHFPKDGHGLYEFDGQPLYEYQGEDRKENRGWGTRCFDVGRPEVQSFLISNALYWFREFHADGLRVDAVASMLYLDYDKEPGKWVPNVNGTNHNLEAISFFKKMNSAIFAEFPDVLVIAEESTSWPMITKPAASGGLGFNFKWNMGWANDMYDYLETDPVARKYKHSALTFPLVYAFSENYILPVSHDEVVHGKKSLVDKCFGSYDEKFSCMRTFIMYMMTLPGKKLMFMGTEYAQFREWDYENQLEWFMTEYPRHIEMQRFVREMNRFYLENSELWEIDDSWDGFEWIDADMSDLNIISYRRKNKKGREVVVVLNFAPVVREHFTLKVPRLGRYEEIMTTDKYEFGGKNTLNPEGMRTHNIVNEDGTKYCAVELTLPALGGVILRKQMNNKEKTV